MSDEHPIVFVVDDDPSMRDALKNLLRSMDIAVETFRSAQEFLASPRSKAAGCLVLDVRLPGSSGLDLQRQLKETNIQIPIIFITGHGDIQMSVRAMKAGAMEFFTKPFKDQDLLDAVQQALDRDRVARSERAQTRGLRERYESLSPREQDIMGFVAGGLLNKQIAAELGTSEATIKMHRGHLMQKMHADSLAELLQFAHTLGLATNKGRTERSV
jgi:FixJ family two-component response regulator